MNRQNQQKISVFLKEDLLQNGMLHFMIRLSQSSETRWKVRIYAGVEFTQAKKLLFGKRLVT